MFYVSMKDTTLSGEHHPDKKTTRVVVPCMSREIANEVIDEFQSRRYLDFFMFHRSKPNFDPVRYEVVLKPMRSRLRRSI